MAKNRVRGWVNFEISWVQISLDFQITDFQGFYSILAQNWPCGCGPFLARYCVGKAHRDPTIFFLTQGNFTERPSVCTLG